MKQLTIFFLFLFLSFTTKCNEISIFDRQSNEILIQESLPEKNVITPNIAFKDRSFKENAKEDLKNNQLLLIWLDDHVEERPMYEAMLSNIQASGITLWRANLIESYFLPRSSENIRTLSGDGVAALITAALQQSNKQIMIAAYERTPLPVLRGIRQWQLNNPPNPRFLGSVLFYPNLFGPAPLAGEDPELDPIVYASNTPMVIIQPDSGSQRLRLATVMQALWQAGAPAVSYVAPNIRDWFFMGESDHGSGDIKATKAIPGQLHQFAKIFRSLPKAPKALPERQQKTKSSHVQGLVKYQSKRPTPNYDLFDFKSKTQFQSDYTGKVTLVNFWATWCPPCVEEVPSLNRLQKRYSQQPFDLVSIDYREEKPQLQSFMEKIDVDFPILLDDSGETALDWKVFSFPSSFIIDKKGKIRYSANRAIDWDTEEVWQVIDSLLTESG